VISSGEPCWHLPSYTNSVTTGVGVTLRDLALSTCQISTVLAIHLLLQFLHLEEHALPVLWQVYAPLLLFGSKLAPFKWM
jgi:hypothetical protein